MTKFLITAVNLEISYLARFPELLVYGIEQRLKPRLEVKEILEKKILFRKKTSSITTFKVSRKKLLEKYALPCSNELGEDYVANWQL